MRIAFDVKGTLDGVDENRMVRLFRVLEKLGHTMIVWSSDSGFAVDVMKKHGINGEIYTKYTKGSYEAESYGLMDVAIEDDRSQTWLAAKQIVFVHDVPDDVEAFALTVGKGQNQ